MAIVYDPDTGLVTLDDGSTVPFEVYFNEPQKLVVASEDGVWVGDEEPTPNKDEDEKARMTRFFFGEKKNYTGTARQWKAEGRCPICGELGRVHKFAFVCSRHGEY